ncbi:hypothetical protein EOD23_34015 [Mesorhizobium sp. USDA-HM6]|nr:hypothetical protein EOD23_34015 [Mesorhizobium sp. USDA-HM6]
MKPEIDVFVADARSVSVEDAAKRLGLKFTGSRHEHPQPCPYCGGNTFAFNTAKNKWNCRAGGIGGQDGIGMAAHCRRFGSPAGMVISASGLTPVTDRPRFKKKKGRWYDIKRARQVIEEAETGDDVQPEDVLRFMEPDAAAEKTRADSDSVDGARAPAR